MSALQKYLNISLHETEWGEMTLLQQATLQHDAIAELARLQRIEAAAREFVDSDGRDDPPEKYQRLKAALKGVEE